MTAPLVSVVIPPHHHEVEVVHAMRSAIRQGEVAAEGIVNPGSPLN